jgi:serine/threonine-protein kinase
MIAGEPPFTGPTVQAIAMRQLLEQPRPLRTRRPSTPKCVDAAVMHALEKVPGDRFGTVKQFARELRVAVMVPPKVMPWLRVALPAFLAVVSSGAAAVIYARSQRTAATVSSVALQSANVSNEQQRRIAVLYFDDNTDQHRLRYLADGLTESVITQLNAVQGLTVVSRNGVRQFRDSVIAFDAMVKALNVGSVVEGSLRASGDSVYVTVRLVDAASGTSVGSTSIARPANNVVSLDDEIGYQVSIFLRRRLGEQLARRSVRAGTRSEKAFDQVLRAERLRKDAAELSQRADSVGSRTAIAQLLSRADRLLESAEAEDLRWVQPPVARGWIALAVAGVEEGTNARRALLQKAQGHANRAMARDSTNPAVLELVGTVEWSRATLGYTAKTDDLLAAAAREHLRAAVAHDSTLASAWATLSTLLRFSGNPDEAREADLYAKRALDADAYLTNAGAILNGLFRSAVHLGDYAEARKWCDQGKRATVADPMFVECDLTLMVYERVTPQPAWAWSVVDTLAQLEPAQNARASGYPYNPIHRRMLAAIVSARAGDSERARHTLTRARSEVADDAGLRVDLLLDEAALWNALGIRDSATNAVEAYIAARGYRKYLASDPLYAPITVAAPAPPRYQARDTLRASVSGSRRYP